MKRFDHHYVEELIARLRKLSPDAKPQWGTMTGAQLLGHLIMVMRYCLGKGPEMPNKSTWFTRNVLGPLVLNGLLAIPKDVKLPRLSGKRPGLPADGDIETLHAVLEEYLHAAQTGELKPPHHFAFGDLGVDGWAKMHVRHFEHHLKQFGL